MKTKFNLFILFIALTISTLVNAQQIPLVYDVEHTGADFPLPVMPEFSELPVIQPLTDPFEWSDGSGRDTTFASWSHRRAEIKAEIENYEIGTKPVRPENIKAVMNGTSELVVTIYENNDSLTLRASVSLPEGEGPFPTLITMDFLTLPSHVFTDRNIAIIGFSSGQVMAHTQTRGQEPINRLYPDLTYMGAYSAWSWGVSRLIDGIELVQDELPVDLQHLGVSGCSYAGKMALFAGAFDERIALTIAQEPGGGGAAAWRVSETLGNVEKLGATNSAWFIRDMFRFSGSNVSKLPHDHHELVAMVAPRALLVLGNPDMTWLAEEAGYVSCRAARKVWEAFGIEDRMGFSILGGHGHCDLPAKQYPELEAFVDKFMLGDTTANTNVQLSTFEHVDDARWYEWWGTGEAVFPDRHSGPSKTITFEPECENVGENWNIVKDAAASNGGYITVQPGTQSLSEAPNTEAGLLTIEFSIDSTATYALYARLNCPSPDDDSFWIKFDDGSFEMYNGLGTNGWQWMNFGNHLLEEGTHTMSWGYREDGAQLDKISLSTNQYEPEEMGLEAENTCDVGVGIEDLKNTKGYSLIENYPNPFTHSTNIEFEIPERTHVSLKVYNTKGEEIEELADKNFSKGKHTITYSPNKLPNGIYIYTLKTDNFQASGRMKLQN